MKHAAQQVNQAVPEKVQGVPVRIVALLVFLAFLVGSLDELYKKVSFSFMIPTILFLGCLYASVTGRFVFFRAFRGSRHMKEHTLVGWTAWGSILLVTWIAAFIISQVIPFFSSCKSIRSQLLWCDMC